MPAVTECRVSCCHPDWSTSANTSTIHVWATIVPAAMKAAMRTQRATTSDNRAGRAVLVASAWPSIRLVRKSLSVSSRMSAITTLRVSSIADGMEKRSAMAP